MNRQELLIALHAGRERLRAALAALPDASMLDEVDPGWTRKDVVAHLEAWERRVVDLFERLRSGEPPPEPGETDDLNARFLSADRHRSLEDVRRGEEAAWAGLLATVEGATDDELFDPDHFDWTEGDPFVDWITGNANEHIDEHLEQLGRGARRQHPVAARAG
jgi:hypothetical protein